MQKNYTWYKKFFGIYEIENSTILKILFFVLVFSFFTTFDIWMGNGVVTTKAYFSGEYSCPPYFTSCGELFFFDRLPISYGQEMFYMILYVFLIYGVYSAYKNDWVMAHFSLIIPLVWKVIFSFLLTYGAVGNFDYYDMILACIFLFARNKEYFAKLVFVVFYFLASTIKIHEGWIFGNYFSSLITGMPFFPESTVPFFTNILIFMQMIGAWFLLSNNKKLQRLAFIYFLIFHIYSGILVHFRYTTISLTAFIVLFAEHKPWNILAVSRKTIFGYVLIFFLFIGQLIAPLIDGDHRKTLEANYFGLFMFEANHQCISNAKFFYKDGTFEEAIRGNVVANNRCDVFKYWSRIKTQCDRNPKIEHVAWTFDHSINGHKFERIVDVDNACILKYELFRHNNWIKIGSEANVLDKPVYKNGYKYPLDEKIQVETTPYINDYLLNYIEIFYWLLWVVTLIYLLYKLFSISIKKD